MNPPNHDAILITGGAGFIGSHVLARLMSTGRRVVVVDCFDPFYDPEIKEANFQRCLQTARPGQVSLIRADLAEPEAIEQIKNTGLRFESIVHLAAKAGVRPSIQAPVEYARANITATLNLLEFAAKSGIRHFVFGSSSSVYGNNKKVPFSESDPVDHPISPYAATKKAGELLCHTYHQLYQLNVACLRFFTVYGPWQRPDLAIHKFARLILEGKPIPFYGDGSTRRDYTYVDDIVDGVIKTLRFLETSAQPRYEILNLGESKTVSLAELVSRLERLLGKSATLNRMPLQPGDVQQTYADITRARELVGYDPRYPIEEGLKQFVDWLRAHSKGMPA